MSFHDKTVSLLNPVHLFLCIQMTRLKSIFEVDVSGPEHSFL